MLLIYPRNAFRLPFLLLLSLLFLRFRSHSAGLGARLGFNPLGSVLRPASIRWGRKMGGFLKLPGKKLDESGGLKSWMHENGLLLLMGNETIETFRLAYDDKMKATHCKLLERLRDAS